VWCGEAVRGEDRLEIDGYSARVAPMGKRVLAFGIDLAVLYGVQTALNVVGLLAGFGFRWDEKRFDDYRACTRAAPTPEARTDCLDDLLPHLPLILLLGFLVPFAIAMVYWAVCNVRGVSIGKWAAGIRVVDARGRRPGVGRGVGRTLAALFLSSPPLWLGYWWAFWQRRHRTWHDMIAGTYVVRVPPTAAEAVNRDPGATPVPPTS
jgi:uncharacterized RDD family membrane protein YckC